MLSPNNECDLEGFHFTEGESDYATEQELGCNTSVRGERLLVTMLLYGKRQCSEIDTRKIAECLAKAYTKCEDIKINIQPVRFSTDIPSIINGYFASYRQQFQSAQPCSSMLKITYVLDITYHGTV